MKYRFCIDGQKIEDVEYLTEIPPLALDREKKRFAEKYNLSGIGGIKVFCLTKKRRKP